MAISISLSEKTLFNVAWLSTSILPVLLPMKILIPQMSCFFYSPPGLCRPYRCPAPCKMVIRQPNCSRPVRIFLPAVPYSTHWGWCGHFHETGYAARHRGHAFRMNGSFMCQSGSRKCTWSSMTPGNTWSSSPLISLIRSFYTDGRVGMFNPPATDQYIAGFYFPFIHHPDIL